jgi:hypothetical protein
MNKKSIENRHWIWTNERIRELPFECRDHLLDYAREDVDACIRNNGMHDRICQDMAKEVRDMEWYMSPSPWERE